MNDDTVGELRQQILRRLLTALDRNPSEWAQTGSGTFSLDGFSVRKNYNGEIYIELNGTSFGWWANKQLYAKVIPIVRYYKQLEEEKERAAEVVKLNELIASIEHFEPAPLEKLYPPEPVEEIRPWWKRLFVRGPA